MWRRGQVLTTLENLKVMRIVGIAVTPFMVGVAAAPSIVGFAAAPSEWIDMETAAALGS